MLLGYVSAVYAYIRWLEVSGVVRVSSSPGVDLIAMNKAGVPAISPLQDARDYFTYHHTAADTLRRNLALIAPLVYALAQL